MLTGKLNAVVGIRYAAALLSGFALALAFPKPGFDLLAWVAFVPLLFAIRGQRTARTFVLAWLQGLVGFTIELGWVLSAMRGIGGAGLLHAYLFLALAAAFLAIYGATALTVAIRVSRRFALPLLLTVPAAWVAMEWVRTYWPLGFPCDLVGDAAAPRLPVIQIAEFTGVYGVSALILFFNCALYEALGPGRTARRRIGVAVGLAATMALVLAFGVIRMRQIARQRPDGTLRVGMIQGDIPQYLKWDPAYLAPSFKVYTQGSEAALRQRPDLIIWPETAAPFLFQPTEFYPAGMQTQRAYRRRLLQLAQTLHTPILFGAPSLRFARDLTFRNRVYLVRADGQIGGYYDKLRLAPVAEYVPLRPVLGHFIHRWVQTVGGLDVAPGDRQTIFEVDGVRLAVLICYESLFPDLSREAAAAGANVLVNLSNDASFGRSAEPYQVLAMSVFRAIENRVPIVRLANSGISALITPTGRVTAATPLFVQTTEVEDVPWRRGRTVYTVVGDLFAELCLVLSIIGVAATFLTSRFSALPRRQVDRDGSPN